MVLVFFLQHTCFKHGFKTGMELKKKKFNNLFLGTWKASRYSSTRNYPHFDQHSKTQAVLAGEDSGPQH